MSGTALQYRMSVQYRVSLYPPDQSRLLRPQSNLPLSRSPAPQGRGRSSGDGRVRKLARCGWEVSIFAMTTEVGQIGVSALQVTHKLQQGLTNAPSASGILCT